MKIFIMIYTESVGRTFNNISPEDWKVFFGKYQLRLSILEAGCVEAEVTVSLKNQNDISLQAIAATV